MSPPPIKETEVVQPAGMMAIGEPFTGGMDFLRSRLDYLVRTKKASTRHQGKASVLFCDGHVESPSLAVLFSDADDVALSRWNRDNQPHRECLAP
jgi:prepilin-type processing-associated H-X9-DG protein